MNVWDLLRRTTVQVVCALPDGRLRLAGSGAVHHVYDNGTRARVLTAAHVWESMAEDLAAGGQPGVIFRRESKIGADVDVAVQAARVVKCWLHPGRPGPERPETDIAVLEAKGNALGPSIGLGATPPRPGANIALAGYPSINGGAAFRIEVGQYGDTVDGVPRCLLSATNGDSGGPVVDLASGKLVGILSGAGLAEPGAGLRIGVSWLAPLSSIMNMLPNLEEPWTSTASAR